MNRRDFVSGTMAGVAMASSNLLSENARAAARERPMQAFRLAAVTLRSFPASPEANLKQMEAWTIKCKQAGASLACFPELCVTGYLTAPSIWEAAEPVPGPSTEKLQVIAEKTGILIAAGIAEKEHGIVYDTYVFVGPAGYIGKSRKMHIPPAEVGYWRGGGVAPVIDIGTARAGVNICFDNWLPESSRIVALQGAEIIFAPYVWAVGPWGNPPDHRSRNRAWKDYAGRTFPARAIDNGVFFVALNSCGPVPNGNHTYYGNPVAMIYSPLGKLIAESPDEAGDEVMVVADIDPALLKERRSQGVFHPRFRRPELYGLLAEGDTGPQKAY